MHLCTKNEMKAKKTQERDFLLWRGGRFKLYAPLSNPMSVHVKSKGSFRVGSHVKPVSSLLRDGSFARCVLVGLGQPRTGRKRQHDKKLFATLLFWLAPVPRTKAIISKEDTITKAKSEFLFNHLETSYTFQPLNRSWTKDWKKLACLYRETEVEM